MRHWLKFLTLLLTLNITGAMLLAPASADEFSSGFARKESFEHQHLISGLSPVYTMAPMNSMASTSR